MIQIYKKRSFYELINEDAIILNFLFGYRVFTHNNYIELNLTESEFLNAIKFLNEKKISYTIYYDVIKIEKKDFKNKNYEMLLTRTQKELPSAYELKETLFKVKNYLEELNGNTPKFESVNFYGDIESLIDINKKTNLENLIKDYRLKNKETILFNENALEKNNKIVNECIKNIDNEKKIKLGSTVTLQKEDDEKIEKFVLVEDYDETKSNGLNINSVLGRALLGKEEWDFVELNNSYFQIIEVIN